MNFFDRFPVRLPPAPEPVPASPFWAKPPAVLGGGVPAQAVLARSAGAVVGVGGLIAYPNGFSFTVTVLLREDDPHARAFPGMFHDDLYDAEGTPMPGFLRIGIQFADGGAASNLSAHPGANPDENPTGPLLLRDRGGGGNQRYDMDYWVWPLPPPGPVTLFCEWPAFGITESRVEVDAHLINEAAARAITLWPPEQGQG